MNSIKMLEIVAQSLDPLLEQVVFVGGAVAGLYAGENNYGLFRPTEDVDCVINVMTRLGYSGIEAELRELGFENDLVSEARVICRWNINDILVDIMPIKGNDKLLGFTNQWYEPGFKNKIEVVLPSEKKISIFSLPYFLASKFEALEKRGDSDWRLAHDLEDILSILDNVDNPVNYIDKSNLDVRSYLINTFSNLLSKPNIDEILDAHLASISIAKCKSIIERISSLK